MRRCLLLVWCIAMVLVDVNLCADTSSNNRVRHAINTPKKRDIKPDRRKEEVVSKILRLAQGRQPLPDAVTFSIVLVMPLDESGQWRTTLLYYMLSLQKRRLQRQARAYEIVFSGGNESAYLEASAVVSSMCHTCIVRSTDQSVHVASVEGIARHGSGGLTDEEAEKHVVLYIGHLFPTTHSVVSLPANVADGAAVFNSVAGGWVTTLNAFNRDDSVQVAGCGFDEVGRPLLNQWYARASYLRKLVHPFEYFPNSFFYGMCGAGCVNDWMVTIDKQFRVENVGRVTMCTEHVLAQTGSSFV